MNIVRFIYDWPPPWMGLAPGPYEMTRTQAQRGHRLTVYCGAGKGGDCQPVDGAKIIPLPRAIKGILIFTAAPVLLLRFLLRGDSMRADVVHGHAHVTQWYNLWRLLFGGKAPYFYHLHVTFAGREAALRAKGYRFSLAERFGNHVGRLCDRWGCRAATHIFATNESVKAEAVLHAGAPPEKVTVVRNGVNTLLFRPGPKPLSLMTRLGLEANDRVLLYVGVLNARKNLGPLLSAMAKLPPHYKLVLAGRGPDDYVESLQAKAKELGIFDRLRFGGYVEYPDLPDWYCLSDIFVLPSLYEGLPKVLLEALACRKPAVLHAGYELDTGLETYVLKADCASSEDLAARIQEADNLGFKGDFQKFLNQFSWKCIMDQVETVYLRHMPDRKARTNT